MDASSAIVVKAMYVLSRLRGLFRNLFLQLNKAPFVDVSATHVSCDHCLADDGSPIVDISTEARVADGLFAVWSVTVSFGESAWRLEATLSWNTQIRLASYESSVGCIDELEQAVDQVGRRLDDYVALIRKEVEKGEAHLENISRNIT